MNRSIVAAAAVLATLSVAGCGDQANGKAKDDKAETAAIPVEVRDPKLGEMLAVYAGTATLEADGEAVVVAKVGGEVKRILVEEGQSVREGQVLAVLDGDQLRLQLEQSAANLQKLERDYQRNSDLHAKGLVAESAVDNVKSDLDALRASHDIAKLQLSYTEIRAPIAGVVAERNIKVGNTIQPNTVVFKVTDMEPLLAYVHAPERELRLLSPGQSAQIAVDAMPGQVFIGKIARVSPVVDPATGTFKITVEVDDPTAKLKPGMFARVGVVYERRANALQIPRTAIVDNDGQATVFVVNQAKAEQRDIKTGLANAGFIEVTEGLKQGEQVVVVGQNGLKTGNLVRVVTLEKETESAKR
ncbi:MAG TPA: efflux RND transporter periplasmic adaptor subunit [Steroidobacteraceae bacterium]|nr:efflux RND transporter periplasmic adaptor subunit [Steroidobacteraceae bacterium]